MASAFDGRFCRAWDWCPLTLGIWFTSPNQICVGIYIPNSWVMWKKMGHHSQALKNCRQVCLQLPRTWRRDLTKGTCRRKRTVQHGTWECVLLPGLLGISVIYCNPQCGWVLVDQIYPIVSMRWHGSSFLGSNGTWVILMDELSMGKLSS